MWTKLLIGSGLALCAACATSLPAGSKPTAAEAQPPVGCVADTASRIPVSPRDCPGFGRTWTDQDLRSTGATDAAQALRQLDPTANVTGR